MRIGVPKQLKEQEYRVGLTPASVHALCDAGHDLLVEEGAGFGSGMPDDDYRAAEHGSSRVSIASSKSPT